MSVNCGKCPVKKEPSVGWLFCFIKKVGLGLKNIPRTQLHLPPGWQIRTCLESARQRRIELISRAVAVVGNGDRLKITGGGSVFPYTPFTADQVSKIYKINAE